MTRRDKMNYYLDIAQTVAERSTCLRRCYGAILVKDDEIVSTGYNGAPRGRKTAPTWAAVPGRSWASPPGSATSSAAASTPKLTASFPPPAGRAWVARSIWPASIRRAES